MTPITLQRDSTAAWAAILLILAALYRFPSAHLRLSFQVLMEIAVSLLLAYVIFTRANRWWAAFLAAALVSSMFPFYTRHSFLAYHAVLFAAIWYVLLVLYVDRSGVNLLMDALCIIALCQVAFMIIQAAGWDPLFQPAAGRDYRPVTGLMANRNELSALLAFCFPAFLRGRRHVGLLGIALGFCLAKSAGGLVAAAAGWMAYETLRARFKWSLIAAVVAAGAIVLLYGIFVDSPSLVSRLDIWRRSLSMYRQHWLFGGGLGHWQLVAPVRGGLRYTFVHNEYLQGLFEMGIPFAVIVTGYIAQAALRLKTAAASARIPAAALVVIAVNAGVNFPFHIATTAMIAVTWIAIFEIETR